MITSRQNTLIKKLRKLRQSKERRTQGLVLLEGINGIEAALQQGYNLAVFCYTEQWQARHPDLWEQGVDNAERSEVVTLEVIESIATTVHSEGAIAAFEPTQLNLVPPEPLSLGLMVERLQDPGNLGTVIRTAAAAEADGIWLSADSVDPQSPKVLRASAGAWFQMPILSCADLLGAIASHQQAGVQVIATTAQGAQDYWSVDWCKPSLILLGNERAGLSPELLQAADQQVRIPQAATVESLNLGISAAVLLYEAKRQRHH